MNPQNSPTPAATSGGSGASGGVTDSGAALAETTGSLKESAREAASKVRHAASDTAARFKDEAGRYAAQQKDAAAGRIGSYSSAIHETAQSLEEKDPNIAWFTHQAADKLNSVADYMRSRDLDTMRRDVEDVVRRHPAVFFGGMFLAGLVIGNIVKASRRKLEEGSSYDDEDYESEWMQVQHAEASSEPNLTAEERTSAGL